MDLDVLLIDADEKKINDMMPYITDAQIGDSTNEAFIASLGVRNFDLCFVAIANDFQSSLETTALLKDYGAKKVIAVANRDIHAKFLLRNGADDVVYPEKQLASWTALKATSDHIFDYIELDNDYSIYEVLVPKEWVGNSVGEIEVRRKFNILIMAIKKDGRLDMNITFETIFEEESRLLVLGKWKDVEKCFHLSD